MRVNIYPTFDLFFESYLDDFIEINRYEKIDLDEYRFNLIFEYAKIGKALPFNDDELEQEKIYLEDTFGIFHLIFLLNEYDFEDRLPLIENTQKLSKILRKQMFKITSYLKNEILRKEIKKANEDNREVNNINSFLQYPELIQKNANSFFRGKIELIDLLRYFYDNFHSSSLKTKDLTKFNQIFAYFNSYNDKIDKAKGSLDKNAFKALVKQLFGFDYGKSEIKGETQKHIEQLENLAQQYYKIQEKS